jgi:hypothetical protein
MLQSVPHGETLQVDPQASLDALYTSVESAAHVTMRAPCTQGNWAGAAAVQQSQDEVEGAAALHQIAEVPNASTAAAGHARRLQVMR